MYINVNSKSLKLSNRKRYQIPNSYPLRAESNTYHKNDHFQLIDTQWVD